MNIGTLIATLGVNTAGLDIAMAKMKAFEVQTNKTILALNMRLKSAGTAMKTFGASAMKYLTLPLALVGGAAFATFKKFDASMAKITGLVGVAKKQVDLWRESVLKLGPEIGVGPNELANALFFVTSAGIKGKEAMEVLEMSAKAAVSGLGDTKVVADLVTSAMNAYGVANLSAAQATDILVATVREGKAEPAALASSMGMVLPIAAEMGVKFDQVGAAIAGMTRTGTSAATASMQLRQIMASLLKPTSMAEDALRSMNSSSQELRDTIAKDGLLQGLMDIKDMVGENSSAMAKVFPNVRALSGVLDLMGKNAQGNIAIFKSLANATGSLQDALASASQTAEVKWKKAIAGGEVALVRLGEEVSKSFLPILNSMVKQLSKVTAWFADLDASSKKLIMTIAGIALVFGPVMKILGFLVGNIIPNLLLLGGKLITLFNMLTIAIAANPLGAFIVIVLAAAAAIYALNRNMNTLTATQKVMGSLTKETAEGVVKEKVAIENLMSIIENENVSRNQKVEAIRQLNKISPAYLGFIDEEAIKTGTAKTAIDAYLTSLERSIRMKAAEGMLIELEKSRIQSVMDKTDEHVSLMKQAGISFENIWKKGTFVELLREQAAKNASQALQSYIDQKKALQSVLSGEFEKQEDLITQYNAISDAMQKVGTMNKAQLSAMQTRISTQIQLEKNYGDILSKQLKERFEKDASWQRLTTQLKQATANKLGTVMLARINTNIKAREKIISGGFTKELKLETDRNEKSIQQMNQHLKNVQDNAARLKAIESGTGGATSISGMPTEEQKLILNELAGKMQDLNNEQQAYHGTLDQTEVKMRLFGAAVTALHKAKMDPLGVTIQGLIAKNAEWAQGLTDATGPLNMLAIGMQVIKDREKELGAEYDSTADKLKLHEEVKTAAMRNNTITAESYGVLTSAITKYSIAIIKANASQALVDAQTKKEQFGPDFNLAAARAQIYMNVLSKLKDLGVKGGDAWVYYNEQLDNVNATQLEVGISAQQMAQMMGNSIQSIASLFGDMIGDLFRGEFSFGKVFEGLLSIVASFLDALGQALIAAGIAAMTFQNLLLNPFAAIAAGFALVATAAIITKLLQGGPAKMTEGGIIPGGYPNDSFNAKLTSQEAVIPLNRLPGLLGLTTPNLSDQGAKTTFVIKQDALQAILNKKQKYDNSY